MESVLPRHAFSVQEWEEMGRLGLFDEDARMELLDGEIVDMAPIGARHQDCVDRLTEALVRLAGQRVTVRVQGSIRLDDRSEPQPDIALLRRRPEGYADALPTPPDVFLVAEVADTSLASDRAKSVLYAAAGIPECWIVDLQADQVIAMSDAGPGGYRTERSARGADELVVAGIPGARLRAADILRR
ncbi:MAG: Uma2 family endonuclease [Acidimicrobiales bacterium]